MADYVRQRAEEHGYKLNPAGVIRELPSDYDSCDWRYFQEGRRGRKPAYWDYVCYSACHWVCDLALYVASEHAPQFKWRIVTSQKHSTVWNGCKKNPVLFDINFSALGVPPKDAWNLASKFGCVLRLGEDLHPHVYEKSYQKWFNKMRLQLKPSPHAFRQSSKTNNYSPLP